MRPSAKRCGASLSQDGCHTNPSQDMRHEEQQQACRWHGGSSSAVHGEGDRPITPLRIYGVGGSAGGNMSQSSRMMS